MEEVSHAETLYAFATSCWLSTLTFTKLSLPGRASAVARCSNTGAIVLQGPHPFGWEITSAKAQE